jgi:RimJ/RimL family protein N-acetyltransferase
LILRPLTEEDANGAYPDWFNDAGTCAGNSHHVYPYTKAQALDFIRAVRGDRTGVVLAMVMKATNAHVGNVSLQHIHPVHRSAELAIIIGDPQARGQGLGEEACRAIITHGFRALNLHRIECGTFATNRGMISTATRLGFTQEGVKRQAIFKEGAYIDVVQFGLLVDDFKTP